MGQTGTIKLRTSPSNLVYPIQTIWRIRNYQRSSSDISPEANTFGNNIPERSSGKHDGWDLVAPIGTECFSIREGTVELADFISGYGDSVQASFKFNGATYYVLYSHLKEHNTYVKTGDKISAGTLIGLTGDSGNAKGGPPHLHLQFSGDLYLTNNMNPTFFFGAPPF